MAHGYTSGADWRKVACALIEIGKLVDGRGVVYALGHGDETEEAVRAAGLWGVGGSGLL